MKKYVQRQSLFHARMFFPLWLNACLIHISLTMTVQIYYSCQSTAAKASEKEVKAHKEKISDQTLEIKALRNKAAEWQLKGQYIFQHCSSILNQFLVQMLSSHYCGLVLENEANLNAKEKERDHRVGENNRKMTALKSKVESEHKFLEDKQREIKEKIEKVMLLS